MNCEIYYFSGTGYSLSVARDLAKSLDADLVPVVSTIDQDEISTGADTIGLVFPIYDFKAPGVINDLIGKIKELDRKYIFAVCTYGVMPLDTMKKLEKVIKTSGGTLSGGFAIKMPHNGLGYNRIPPETRMKMFGDSRKTTPIISDYVSSGKNGRIEKADLRDRLRLAVILVKMIPKLVPMLKQAIFHGWDSLGFYPDDKCNSCGTCERICPMNNISMNGEKPDWGDNCLNCFACLHWCPQQAIQIAKLTKRMERHHHPDVRISDMIEQKENPG
jgi:ferredoxin